MFGRKASGGKVEVLVERILSDTRFLAHVRSSKAPKEGAELWLGEDKLGEHHGVKMIMVARHDTLFELEIAQKQTALLDVLQQIGHMPLPPYIDRPDEEADKERYQTVYNKVPGAVAAPTAGLHFDDALLAQLKAKGVNFAFVTLHVGAGTFQPVRVEQIEDHKMHAEYVEVPQEVCDAIIATKQAGKRVIAVGTTSVRSVECSISDGRKRRTCLNYALFFRYVNFYLSKQKLPRGGLFNYELPLTRKYTDYAGFRFCWLSPYYACVPKCGRKSLSFF